jgi:hypothetical protein
LDLVDTIVGKAESEALVFGDEQPAKREGVLNVLVHDPEAEG